MTGVADTRLLIAWAFPPNVETKLRIADFLEKEISKCLLAPTITLTEFIEIAGTNIGEDAAQNKIQLLKGKGMKTVSIDEEKAIAAGSLLLAHRNIPIADALIASIVKIGIGEYVITDDPHFKELRVKTKWLC